MLSRGISFGFEDPQKSILSIHSYDAQSVWNYTESEHEKVMSQWREYLERRNLGHGPELFSTLEAARTWLASQAPVKLVDGAWLAHVHKITTPFPLRGITKDAWQVFSEELGDGDVSKHHVRLYRHLLAEVGLQLPDCDSAEFIRLAQWEDMENARAWEAAVGQLVISLFPHEFLPEILGFNMHYELITLDTLRAVYELKPLGIDPNYFLLHISIDNADSGHAAMATHTVIRYLEIVRSTEGEGAVEDTWRRVQAGYAMSHALGSPSTSRDGLQSSVSNMPVTSIDPLTTQMINIFKAKALVSHQYHLQSRARIGAHSLPEWLSPTAWADPDPLVHLKFVKELSRAKPWIYPGDSSKSLLVKELQWKGRMFGAFTQDEVTTLRAWIDSLSKAGNTAVYWGFTSRKQLNSADTIMKLQDPVIHYPVVTFNIPDDKEPWILKGLTDSAGSRPLKEPWSEAQRFTLSSDLQLPDLLALWFAHIGLLENTIATPSRTGSPLYANILLILRAQAGFLAETEIIAGMDEMNRASCRSLVDIGLEILSNDREFASCSPTCLNEIFGLSKNHGISEKSQVLTKDMLRWAQRPKQNLGWLLGLAFAFIPVKNAVTKEAQFLGQESRLELKKIVAREEECLVKCANWLENMNEPEYFLLLRGYQYCSAALSQCI
ncbi:hypothetical protein GQ44DRAFT_633206 [Phaeosphaeriaceae sp. PMI808]|nr:hypothetical protein GQ44DRAFT_633206 [Phaeosphaeriaceae sp. PMI808]